MHAWLVRRRRSFPCGTGSWIFHLFQAPFGTGASCPLYPFPDRQVELGGNWRSEHGSVGAHHGRLQLDSGAEEMNIPAGTRNLPFAAESSHCMRCDTVAASMELSLQNQKIDDVVVIRCQGRIVVGAEISSLQLELEKLTQLTKKVVLQLGEVSFIDSVGLGALVRQFGVLRAKGGDLKLCQVSPFLLKVLQVTNLLRILPIYASEAEAIQAFSKGPQFHEETFGDSRTTNRLHRYLP